MCIGDRHGKLVGLYEDWGFTVTPGAKVLFLYNDTECFRKVPMSLSLQPLPDSEDDRNASIIKPTSGQWFCMLTLRAADGSFLAATEDGEIEARPGNSRDSVWQTLLGASSGEVFLRSVHGKFLCVEESGHVLADRPLNSTWETFQVVPLHDESGVALRNFHGGYLCIDSERRTVVSMCEPVPWDGGGDPMSLVCNKHGARPLFSRIMRKYQTAAFAKREAVKFGGFERAAWSVRDACQRVAELTGESRMNESWVLRYMLASAEAARDEGHPDWLQLAVFLYVSPHGLHFRIVSMSSDTCCLELFRRALGLLFLHWTDEENAVLRSISAREWLALNSTWLVGAHIPDSIEFPELNELNADHTSGIKSLTPCPDVLDDALLLPWTPDEYLYRALVHNQASLPSEALVVIRLWSLKTWYQNDSYADVLSFPASMDTKEWLASLGRFSSVSDAAIQQVKPETLLPYYLALADKYLPSVLHW